MFNRMVQEKFYKQASSPADLPWHRDEPEGLLIKALGERDPGRALDLGCGSGVVSVFLAQRNWSVTAIDFISDAIAMARDRGERAGVDVDWVNDDLFAWNGDTPFDLVHDSGCLHSLIGGDVKRYKDRLVQWLAPGGDYILGHFGKRHALDWRPVGPARRTRKQLVDLFSPELTEVEYEQELMTGIDLPIGPTVLGQGFWFQRT